MIAFTIVAVAVYTDFQESYDIQAYVEGPLELVEWPAKFALFFGIGLFAIRLLVDLVQSIHGIIHDTATATRAEEDRVLDTEL